MYRKIATAILIIGAIIVLIGGYYIITNSGMSYSDTTEDILIEYQENIKKGVNLIKTGVFVTMVGLILRYKNRILNNYT